MSTCIVLLVSAALVAVIPATLAQTPCNFPAAMEGEWRMSAPWGSEENTRVHNLTISSTSILSLPYKTDNLFFHCYKKLADTSTYVIRSEMYSILGLKLYLYSCLDISPMESRSDIIFYLSRTVEDEDGFPYIGKPEGTVPNDTEVCSKEKTEFPMHYNLLLKQGFQDNIGNESCPRPLQADFAMNFTSELDKLKCPNGFDMDGCDRSHLNFNYTQCGGNQSSFGNARYTCLVTMKETGNLTYTTIFTPASDQGKHPDEFKYWCMIKEQNGEELIFKKTEGACGSTPTIDFQAEETEDCRASTPAPPTTTASAAGSNITETDNNSTEQTTQPQGGGGQGSGTSSAAKIVAAFSLLLFPTMLLSFFA